MDFWIQFWKIAFVAILAAYYLIAVVLVPLGIYDLFALFKRLGQSRSKQGDRQ